MSKLRAVPPEMIEKRPKMFWFGPAGTGKTMASLQHPAVYLIDTERGATNEQYVQALQAGGGAYYATTDLDEILAEVSSLLTTEHPYKTLVIDPITVPYQDACDRSADRVGTDYGKNKIEPDRKMKRLCALLIRLDMNVILTAHAKPRWIRTRDAKGEEKLSQDGNIFDAYAKLDYLFDLVIETQLRGVEPWAVVRKSRISGFPILSTFPMSYSEIASRYGRDVLERAAAPVQLASTEQVARLEHLVAAVKVDQAIIEKWLTKADAEGFAEMSAEAVGKCIAWIEAKVANQEETSA